MVPLFIISLILITPQGMHTTDRPAKAQSQDACDVELRDILIDYVKRNNQDGTMLLGSCHSADDVSAEKTTVHKTEH